MYDNDTIEVDGKTFRVTIPYDDCGDKPWEREDGHGPVSEWRRAGYSGRSPKAPGERELCNDHGSARFYDFAEACHIARRDGWGFDGKGVAAWQAEGLSLRQIAARAAEADFTRLYDWCNDRWQYVGVVVELLDSEGEGTGETDSLWGVESDAGDYLEEVARECAAEILARLASFPKPAPYEWHAHA